MQRKNKNSYIINYDSHYVFDENKVNISGDILIEKKQKKTKAKKKLNITYPFKIKINYNF